MRRYSFLIAVMLIANAPVVPASAADKAWANCVQEKDPDRGIAGCTRVLLRGMQETAKNRAIAYYNRGVSYRAKGEDDRAIADYSEAISIDPNYAHAYHNRGNAYDAKGEHDRAIADYNEAIRLDPKYARAYYNRAVSYRARGEDDRAIADYNEALRLDPKYKSAYVNRGNAYDAKGEHDRAIADYNEALRLDPKDAIAYNNRGTTFNAKGERDRAIADFNEAIRLDPKYARAYYNRGNVYRARREDDRAIADYSEAIRIDPKFESAYVNRGNAYDAKGEHDRAIADYNEAIRLEPKDAIAYNNRGTTYNIKGERDRAIADFNEAIRLDPKYAAAHNNRGVAYRAKSEEDYAIADYNEAIRLDPRYAKAYYNRGSVYEHKKDLPRALADFERFAELSPSDPDGPSAVARVTAALGSAEARSRPQAHGAVPSDRRVALLIGNSKYQYASFLPNPTNDAQAVASSLRGVGFQSVTVKTDLSREQTISALREFGALADSADWAVVYYSGHGIEYGGVNYIVPVDAQLKVDRDVDLETVDIGKVLTAIDGARKLRLFVLDACRDNPFISQMRRTMASRSLGRGLARVEPEAGTLIVFSAKHGELALDGDGANSPFVAALVRRIPTPNLEIRRLFDLVRDDVLDSTRKRQQPFSYGSLSGSEDYYFLAR